MAELDDTCVLHRGGAAGLRAVQAGASGVLAAGGCHTQLGRRRLTDLDRLCAARGLSPGGSGDLLSATLFLDALAVEDVQEEGALSCKP
jgi:triphosphoribosyl-dephospho-CoA synthase